MGNYNVKRTGQKGITSRQIKKQKTSESNRNRDR